MAQPSQEVERAGSPAGASSSSHSSTSSGSSSTSSSDSGTLTTSTASWCPPPPPQSPVREDEGGDSLVDIEGDEDSAGVVQSSPRDLHEEVIDMDVDARGGEDVAGAVDEGAANHGEEAGEEAMEQVGEQGEGNAEATALDDPNDMSWVSLKMRGFKSFIGPGHPSLEDLQTMFKDPGWKVKGMQDDENITTVANNVKFTMHRVVFQKMGIVPPFTTFQRDILNHLGVAPSQLHPNGWGFMKAFEHLCNRLERTVSTQLFLTIFELSWHGEYGTNMARKEQVSFKNQKGFLGSFSGLIQILCPADGRTNTFGSSPMSRPLPPLLTFCRPARRGCRSSLSVGGLLTLRRNVASIPSSCRNWMMKIKLPSPSFKIFLACSPKTLKGTFLVGPFACSRGKN